MSHIQLAEHKSLPPPPPPPPPPPLGLACSFSAYQQLYHKSIQCQVLHTLKSAVTTQLYYHLFALFALGSSSLPSIEQHFLSRKMFSQSLKKRQQNKARLTSKKSDSMDFPAIISVVCQYSLGQFIPGICITCDPTGVADSLLVTKYSSILYTR